MSRGLSVERIIQNQVHNFLLHFKNALKHLKPATRYAERLLGKVLVHTYCKTKIQEEQLITKEQIEMFE